MDGYDDNFMGRSIAALLIALGIFVIGVIYHAVGR